MDPSYNSPGVFSAGGGQLVVSGVSQGVAMGRGENKKRNIIIFLVIIIVVVAIALGAVFFFRQSKAKDDTVVALNRYSNYLLYGEIKDERIDSFDDWASGQEMRRILGSGDIDVMQEYVGKLSGLYDDFYNEYKSSGLYDEDSSLFDLTLTNRDKLAILSEYAKTPKVDLKDIVDYYFKSGGGATVQYVEGVYNGMLNGNSIDSQEYARLKVEQTKSVVELYDLYANNGCLINNSVNTVCVSGIQKGELSAILNSISEKQDLIDDAEEHVVYDVLSYSRMIYEQIDGRVD